MVALRKSILHGRPMAIKAGMRMLDLSDAGIAAWQSRLPSDIKAIIGDDDVSPPEDLLLRLRSSEAEEIPAIVVGDPDMAEALGRARRIRLVAWLVSQAFEQGDDAAAIVDILTGEDDEGSETASSGRILFLEDLRMLNAVIADRIAARVAAPAALMAAAEVAVVLESEATNGYLGGIP